MESRSPNRRMKKRRNFGDGRIRRSRAWPPDQSRRTFRADDLYYCRRKQKYVPGRSRGIRAPQAQARSIQISNAALSVRKSFPNDLVECGSKGRQFAIKGRLEGANTMQDGDVVEFRFNVWFADSLDGFKRSKRVLFISRYKFSNVYELEIFLKCR